MKTCLRCNQTLLLDAFHSRSHISKHTGLPTTYYGSYCKVCNVKICKERRQSVTGLFSDVYNGQLNSSKQRGHPAPNYTKEELQAWLEAQPNFVQLCENWIASGYSRWLKPSPDRLDETQPYTLNNLRLITWGENAESFKTKKVDMGVGDCITVHQYLGGILINSYHSLNEAARQVGGSAGNILRCCRGEYKTSKGFTWKIQQP